jgi:hypothetical protein
MSLPMKVIPGSSGARSRQKPAPGSKRERLMDMVDKYLQAHHHPTAKTKQGIAAALGLTINQVQGALLDIDMWSSTVRSIPSPKNGNKVSPGWNAQSKSGVVTQMRHLATRDETMSLHLEKGADQEADPATAAMMRMVARQSETHAANVRDAITVMNK